MKKLRSISQSAFLILTLAALVIAAAPQVNKILSDQARNHIGEKATVCGLVVATRYLDNSKAKPTFLNFDQTFPNQTFTVVIFESDRAKFREAPEKLYDGQHICVTGMIREYRKKPEMIVKGPDQIVMMTE